MSNMVNEIIILCTKDEVIKGNIISILSGKGFRLIEADDERMLFSLVEEYKPAVLIIDSVISEIMGYRSWEIMKRLDRFRDIKIVLITSVSLHYIDGAYELADGVVERDMVNDEILSAISKFILPVEDVQVHEDAKRLARAIVSDIVYYNSEAALRGSADGTFYDLLGKEIEEGRLLYQRRVPQNIRSVSDYYDCALRDVMMKIQQYNLVLP